MELPRRMTAAVLAASLLALPVGGQFSAQAMPFAGALPQGVASQSGDDAQVVQVQHRPRGGGGPRRGGYRGGGGHGDDGAVAAGILGGLFLGAIIANEAQRNRSVDYCVRHFRSYDPASGTYVGNDGRRHRCP